MLLCVECTKEKIITLARQPKTTILNLPFLPLTITTVITTVIPLVNALLFFLFILNPFMYLSHLNLVYQC